MSYMIQSATKVVTLLHLYTQVLSNKLVSWQATRWETIFVTNNTYTYIEKECLQIQMSCTKCRLKENSTYVDFRSWYKPLDQGTRYGYKIRSPANTYLLALKCRSQVSHTPALHSNSLPVIELFPIMGVLETMLLRPLERGAFAVLKQATFVDPSDIVLLDDNW